METKKVKCVRSHEVLGITKGRVYEHIPPNDIVQDMLFVTNDRGRQRWIKVKFFEDVEK